MIPATVSNIYVQSSYAGVAHLLYATISGGAVTVSENDEIDASEGISTGRSRAASSWNTALNSCLSYSSWNSANGRLTKEYRTTATALDASTLNALNRTLSEGADNSSYAMYSDFYISKAANIDIRYIDGETAAQCIFGYYCFKGTTPPTDASELNKIIIFPNANKSTKGVAKNDQVRLKFYNAETGKFEDSFPAGYTLGFFVINNGWIGETTTFYSTTSLNADKRTHTAAFDIDDNGTVTRVLAIEDWYNNDYNDIMFNVIADPLDAIGDVPVVTPSDEEDITYTTYRGVLTFEDLWPSKGDYDLNDVIIKYESKIYVGAKDGKVIKTVDDYTVLWSGATYTDGFGYELPIAASNVNTTVTSDVTFAGQGKEASTGKASILLFDNIRRQVGATATVTNEFTNRVSISELGAAPYNPFIICKTDNNIGTGRREVHLVDNAPTEFADMTMLGTKDDLSIPASGLYYRSDENFPFAIHMPGVTDLGDFLNKEYEAKPISTFFPRYNDWVTSKGENNKDWYNHYK